MKIVRSDALRNEALVIAAMPGTCTELATKTEMKTNTVGKIVRRLLKSERIYVSGRASRVCRAGKEIAIYSAVNQVIELPKIRTQWVGGSHPCAIEQDAFSIIRKALIEGKGARDAVTGTNYGRAVARRLQKELGICNPRGGFRGVNPPQRMAA